MPKTKKETDVVKSIFTELGGPAFVLAQKVAAGELPLDSVRAGLDKLVAGEFGRADDPRESAVVISPNAPVLVPDDWRDNLARIEQKHKRQFCFTGSYVTPYTMPTVGGSQGYSRQDADEMMEELARSGRQFPATAAVLDTLIDNPWLIPKNLDKKLKYLCWGTKYCLKSDYVRIRYLVFVDGHWTWGYEQLLPRFTGVIFGRMHPLLMVVMP